MTYVSYNYTKTLVDYANENHLISKSFLAKMRRKPSPLMAVI
jgi:hypothetical protein